MPRVLWPFCQRRPWLLPSLVCLGIQAGLSVALLALARLMDSSPPSPASVEAIARGRAAVGGHADVALRRRTAQQRL